MQAYLDNSATTRPFDDVRELMRTIEDKTYGNPSSMHTMGVLAENHVKEASETLAGILKVKEKEICFTSGGTESDNLALRGCARANSRAGKHLITTRIEHPAVLQTMKHLEEEGFEVTYLDVDGNGVLHPETLEKALRSDTILVSVMHVNNEIGSVQPIEELARLTKAYAPSILFHTDAVQSFGKFMIHPKRMGIDLLSVSAHKIHGPKGIGFLYVDEHVKIAPILYGGGQQKGLRSGTENVAAIAGMAKAAELEYKDLQSKTENLYALKEDFIRRLLTLEAVTVNGLGEGSGLPERIRASAPHIVSASFDKVRSEVLLHALEEQGVYVSAGSACASNKPAVSETLKAIGVKKDLLDSTIRFSFSTDTTKEELDHAFESLSRILSMLRKYTRH